jgi:penicillin-binding protein 1A
VRRVEKEIRTNCKICSRLVLSDVNKNRDELLKNVDTFNKEKEVKRPLIMAERQLRVEYAQKKKQEDAKKKREEYAKKKEEYAQKKKEEDAQK